jgi:predicted DNA-binding antitoxin AbrB/MazE fold protein
MTTTLDAIYDGEVLRFDEPIELEPNTRVRITIEITRPIIKKRRSFLQTAQSLNLQGPSDWSARFEDYLYKRENEFNG